jgi:hypothetical protein
MEEMKKEIFVESNTENNYIDGFYKWFVHRFSSETYRKMGVDHLTWMLNDLDTDLVLVINRKRNILEVESNYFDGGHAEFSLIEIGIRYERHLRGI